MQRLIGIYGASGFGREVMPVLQTLASSELTELVFIDDASDGRKINGHVSLTFAEFCERPSSDRAVAIAIADASVRMRLAIRCADAGISEYDVRAPNAIVGDDVHWGEGVILQPFVCLTSNIRIGKGFHANIYSYVAHDCMIGDYVTFAPGVKCNGNVHIGDKAYIGTGAILRQGSPGKPLTIGEGAVVGMGAVVTKDVPPGATVVGNPAQPLVRR